MDQIILFVRKNILLIIAAVILLGCFFVLQNHALSLTSSSFSVGSRGMAVPSAMGGVAYDQKMAEIAPIRPPGDDYAPQPLVENRLVIQNSYLSLLVDNVKKVRDQILQYTRDQGGYMVSSDVSGDQESPTATVSIRIPSQQMDTVLNTFRGFSVKVVSEHLDGTDVTDQYVDIEKRISILQQTLSQFEELRTKSKEVSDLTTLTKEILNIQSQIDAYKGQQASLEKNAEFSKVTIYLSTDEIALPYQPSDTFRPTVIFKLAVRSLLGTLRSAIGSIIWILVYGVIWIPVVSIIGFLLFKRNRTK